MSSITDPQVLNFIAKTESAYPADANLATAEENRRYYDAMCEQFRQPRPVNVTVEDTIIGHVPVRIYRQMQPDTAKSATLHQAMYLHGGGFVVGSLDSHDDVCAELCSISGFTIIAVDYRLAPEHVYPAQLDDAETVWRHLTADDTKDTVSIIMGDSAGGNLAAALTQRMKRDDGPLPSGQILIYPGLGGDISLPSYRENADAPLLRTKDVLAYKPLYSGGKVVDTIAIAEIAPLQATDFSGLPPCWVITADVDPLRDDGSAYVEKLQQAGGFARLTNEPQLVHGYLRARHMSERAKDSFNHIAALLRDPATW